MSLISVLSPEEARERARQRVAQRMLDERRQAAKRSIEVLRKETPVAISLPPKPKRLPIARRSDGARDWLFITPVAQGAITVKAIVQCVAARHSLSADDIVGNRRDRILTVPRREVSYLSAALTPVTLNGIGRIIGRDHSTILYHIAAAMRDCGLPEPAKISRTHALEILHYGFDGFLEANGRPYT